MPDIIDISIRPVLDNIPTEGQDEVFHTLVRWAMYIDDDLASRSNMSSMLSYSATTVNTNDGTNDTNDTSDTDNKKDRGITASTSSAEEGGRRNK